MYTTYIYKIDMEFFLFFIYRYMFMNLYCGLLVLFIFFIPIFIYITFMDIYDLFYLCKKIAQSSNYFFMSLQAIF